MKVTPKENSCLTNLCVVCQKPTRFMFSRNNYRYFRCLDCKTVVTLPYPTFIQIQEHYKNGSNKSNYAVAIGQCQDTYKCSTVKFFTLITNFLVNRYRALNGLKVLDMGCFTGEFLFHMQQKGADVYGIELQKEAAEIANQKLPGRIYHGDLLGKLPTSFKQFDLVLLSGVIEHVTDPVRLLRRAKEFLVSGGFLIIETPDAGSLISKITGKFWPPFTSIEHIHLFSFIGLNKILSNIGFKTIYCKRHWKILTFSYVYEISKTFGPELHRLLGILNTILPRFFKNIMLPFYAGEKIIIAQKTRD